MDDGSGADVRVLHVDDEPSLTDLVSIYLEREAGDVDLSVSTSNSGADALERLRQEQVDCVVSDYDMPDIDGLEFLRAVRSEHPDLPFILFTGKGSEEVARDAFRVGATDYMQKDTGTDQYTVLANRVVNAVSQYRAKAASERYGTAIEVLDSGVYSLDSSGRFTSADGVFCELTGYDREAIIGREFADLAAESDDEIRAAFERVVAPDAPDTERFETVLSPGPAYPHDDDLLCEGHLALRPTEDDEPAVIGTLQDVTERRRRRNRLRYETRLKDAVLDTSTSLMSAETDEIGTKIEWTLQSVGEVADLDRCSVYLYDDETNVAALMHDWRGGDPREHPARVALEDARWLVERLHRFENVRLHRVSDLPPEASDTKRVLTDAETGGFVAVPMVSKWALVGFVVFDVVETSRSWTDTEVDLLRSVANNVTHTLARQRRERELQRQNDRLEEFASVVSHDLRNPLNVAKGFVELAREEDDVAYLDRALDGVTRMDTLLNDVLKLARQGRKVGETRSVAIENVAERAWKAVDTGDDAVLVVEDGLGSTQADQGRFQQAFENLFRNAVEHGSTGNQTTSGDAVEHGSTGNRTASGDAVEHGSTGRRDAPGDASADGASKDAADELTVRVGPTETGFYVADDGPGIPVDERDTVFEHGHTTSESGTGFGLSIVESIVEAHGWDIEVTAPEPDLGGARFEFDIGGVRSEVEPRFSLSDD
ncbi:two-component system sensor histidine kinase/response regulator [Haloferax sp. Atlit-6N]|uniref:hybrid sensor histidine kinase/response regulator n=1 Tax=Haloferax sp. Atlit-6N TaxID=2077205 RepID=UPI000E24ED86|nr:response regulator [Haloferax sp. Atlit-6N]REA04712.1 two-component system sensor histidine kinase/response regulator [Haloferax sp. Atlit-6N]